MAVQLEKDTEISLRLSCKHFLKIQWYSGKEKGCLVPMKETHVACVAERFLTSNVLPSLDAIQRIVQDNESGAISTFSGTTRGSFGGKIVIQLDYEAYVLMAEKMLHALVATARETWDLTHVVIMHRVGSVPVGEPGVIIAVSSAHRAAAIHAVEFLIDNLKARCPIWKKEVYADGTIAWKGPCNDTDRLPDSGHRK